MPQRRRNKTAQPRRKLADRNRARGAKRANRKLTAPIRGEVFFERGFAIPRQSDLKVLRAHADRLRQDPQAKLLIQGYANQRGVSQEDGASLALARARVIRMLLLAMGVEQRQLTGCVVGGVVPVTNRTGNRQRARNRRVALGISGTEVGVSLVSRAFRRLSAKLTK